MPDYPASFPADFRQIAAELPAGWQKSSRVVQPELRIRKQGSDFILGLAGTKVIRGDQVSWDAADLRHNWVADGKVIRPLPHDTPEVVRKMLGGETPGQIRRTPD